MTNNARIVQTTDDEAHYIRKKLIEFNSKHVPNGIYKEINLGLKDDNKQMFAGLNSALSWNWMEIDILWVDENHRGKGLGGGLLLEAENIARANNCSFIKLNTFSFQAPEFYKKYGYEVMAIIEDAPLGSTHYYFKKMLD